MKNCLIIIRKINDEKIIAHQVKANPFVKELSEKNTVCGIELEAGENPIPVFFIPRAGGAGFCQTCFPTN